jgi:hypothetical protein
LPKRLLSVSEIRLKEKKLLRGIDRKLKYVKLPICVTPPPEEIAATPPPDANALPPADEPTGTSLGVTDEMASGAALPPAPEAVPEFAGAAPHPESRVRRRQKDKIRRK